MNGDDNMSTVTTKRLPDPDDDSIEASLRRFESTLRFWSPLLLGACRTVAPFAYSGAIALSTIIGYALFFAPSLVLATLVADVATNAALFTTLSTVVGSAGAITAVFTTHVWVPALAGVVLYTLLLVAYEPTDPNGTADALFGTKQWRNLVHSLILCGILFVGSTAYAVLTATPLAFIGTAVAAWWVMRRVTFTVLWDETRYMVSPPVTEALVGIRVPTVVGAIVLALGYPLVGVALLVTPFVGSVLYLKWRSMQGDDSTQSLDTVRMHDKSGLPTDMVQDFTPSGAYQATANDELLRGAVDKFNSLLETEIDTERRVHLPQGRLSHSHIESAVSQAESIYADFDEVSYRPERFDDALEEVQKYAEQYQNVLEEERTR